MVLGNWISIHKRMNDYDLTANTQINSKMHSGSSKKRQHRYTYDWFILMFGRNQQNFVKIILQVKNKLKKKALQDLKK